MSTSRWVRPRSLGRLATLVALVGLLALSTSEARAQVFKPRGGKSAAASRATPVATPAARKGAPATAAAATAAAPSRKPTRATGPTPRRVVSAPAAKSGKKARAGKTREDPDAVVIHDDDDDDVKITDED